MQEIIELSNEISIEIDGLCGVIGLKPGGR